MEAEITLRIVAGLAGLVLGLWGRSVFHSALALSGFLLVAGLVASRADALPPEPKWLALVLVLLAGLAGAVLLRLAFRVALFAVGAVAAVAVARAFPELFPGDPRLAVVVLVGVGLVGGLLAQMAEKAGVVIVTAVLGGILLVTAAAPDLATQWTVVCALGLAAVGVGYQTRPRLAAKDQDG